TLSERRTLSPRLRTSFSAQRRTCERCLHQVAPMAVARKSRDKKPMVTASQLAQMGACERFIMLEAKYGKRMALGQRDAIHRGTAEHVRFFKDAVRSQPDVQTTLSKPWCFCATLAWGRTAPETELLRRFRDRLLRRTTVGRWLIREYYSASPSLCRWLVGRT